MAILLRLQFTASLILFLKIVAIYRIIGTSTGHYGFPFQKSGCYTHNSLTSGHDDKSKDVTTRFEDMTAQDVRRGGIG